MAGKGVAGVRGLGKTERVSGDFFSSVPPSRIYVWYRVFCPENPALGRNPIGPSVVPIVKTRAIGRIVTRSLKIRAVLGRTMVLRRDGAPI
jgi:hypothetical protein